MRIWISVAVWSVITTLVVTWGILGILVGWLLPAPIAGLTLGYFLLIMVCVSATIFPLLEHDRIDVRTFWAVISRTGIALAVTGITALAYRDGRVPADLGPLMLHGLLLFMATGAAMFWAWSLAPIRQDLRLRKLASQIP